MPITSGHYVGVSRILLQSTTEAVRCLLPGPLCCKASNGRLLQPCHHMGVCMSSQGLSLVMLLNLVLMRHSFAEMIVKAVARHLSQSCEPLCAALRWQSGCMLLSAG